MAVVNTVLNFETFQQSLWRPGPAKSLSIDTGDTMIYTLPPARWDIGFDLLGNGVAGEFYFDARFGLFAYADLGTGGDFDASFDIEVNVEMPSAIIAGDAMVFDFTNYEVVGSEITTNGFGTSDLSSSGTIGAGIDLIVELAAGIKDFEYYTWFGGDGPFDFEIFDEEHRIELIGVSLEDPEFSFELYKGLTLTARLPTGASIDESQSLNGGGRVVGSGMSDREFLTLDADLDELLVQLTKRIPKVGAVTKALGETVFAEHRIDLNDLISQIPEGKVGLDFVLLDITATAGLAITEEVALDINRPGTQTPDVGILLTSDNGTAGNTADDFSVMTRLGESVSIASPIAGVGDVTVTAEYGINRASFFHGVGLGLNASVTLDVLYGKLAGDWVPDFLAFQFGPLFSVTFPEGGFSINLGNVYEDTFEVDGTAFNTQTEEYEVFYVEQALAPTGWNPDLPGAEERIYAYFQAAYDQIAAAQANYSSAGYTNIQPQGTPQSSYNFSGTSGTLFVWTGAFDQEVTLGTNNGSMAVVDVSGTTGHNLEAAQNGYGFANWNINTPSLFGVVSQVSNSGSFAGVQYRFDGKEFSTNHTAEVIGSNLGDVLFYKPGGASFFDGGDNGAEFDLFIGDFAQFFPGQSVHWDLNDPTVRLFDEIDIRNVEGAALETGSGDDYLVSRTGGGTNVFKTGAGEDIVEFKVNNRTDYAALGADDDVLLYSWSNLTAAGSNPNADVVSGGAGTDNLFLTTLNNGLRYDLHLNFGGSFFQFGGGGIGHDATEQEIGSFYEQLQNFGFSAVTGNTALDVTAGDIFGDSLSASENHLMLINGTTDRGLLRVMPDVERISVINANTGPDLMIFMGGTRYEGGGSTYLGTPGYDTFAAEFNRFESLFPDRGGVRIRQDSFEIDGFWGETVIDGFERWIVTGTTHADYLQGGQQADHFDGGAGNDTLIGGNDSVGDVLIGGAGNDRFYWGDDGADTIRGGDDTDTLDIMAEASSGRLVWRFDTDESGTRVSGSEIFYWAYDSIDLLLDAMDHRNDEALYTSLSFNAGTFAVTSDIEHMTAQGSDDQDDLFIYDGGGFYSGGAWRATGQNTFVADLSDFTVPVDFQIDDDESDTILLGNSTIVQGMDRAIIRSGAGADILRGGRLNDFFDGGEGDDTILGGGGSNELHGGEGDDLFFWSGEGNDTINGGFGVVAGERDSLIMAWADGPSTLDVYRSTGPSTEELLTPTPLSATSSHGDVRDVLTFASQFVRVVTYADNHHADVQQVAGVDVAAPDEYDDIVLFQYGDAYLGGERAGDADFFIGNFSIGRDGPGSAPDYGDLTFRADASGDLPYDIGDGTMVGGFERLNLIFAEGEHTVHGGELGDHIDGGDGAVQFHSGIGDDTFVAGSNGRNLLIHTGGNDTYVAAGGGTAQNDLAYQAQGVVEVQILDGSGNPSGPLLSRVSGPIAAADLQAIYSSSRYALTHDANRLEVDGELQGVLAQGSAGNDVLIGGRGESRLMGGDGDDVLVSESNAATVMIGGDGADTYVFPTIFGNATILDETGSDTVLMLINALQSELSYYAEGTTLVIEQEPAGYVSSNLRIEGYFDDSAAGRGFTVQTSDATFVLNTGAVTGYTGDPVPELTVLSGTGGDDVLGPGNHLGRRIEFWAGENYVESGTGADTVLGGHGRDAVSYVNADSGVNVNLFQQRGFAGNALGDIYNSVEAVVGSDFGDTIIGSGDDNYLASGGGDDSVFAGSGDNTIFLGAGNDTGEASYGDDLIYGEEGDDLILGDEGGVDGGDDMLFGGAGNDTLAGRVGRDVLDGGAGDDNLHGGDGDDVLMYSGGIDLLHGGSGMDWASFFGLSTGIRVDLQTDNEVRENTGPAGTLLANLVSIEALRGTDQADLILGDGDDNIFDAQFGDDTMTGRAGNDTFMGYGANDLVDYSQDGGTHGIDIVWVAYVPGEVADYIEGTDSHGDIDRLYDIGRFRGTEFSDNIQGNQRDNVIWGLGGFDVISGLGGNDLIYSGEGDGDLLFGDQGNDTLVADGGNANDLRGGDGDDVLISGPGSANNSLEGGAGFNTASYQDRTTGLDIDFRFAFGYTGDVYIGGDTDTLYDIQHVIGGQGDDTFRGGDGDDIYSQSGGYDDVDGGAGSNAITFAYYGSAVSIAAGSGEVYSNGLPDISDPAGLPDLAKIMDFANIQHFEGSEFDDSLSTNAGDVTLSGGDGDDTLQSNNGNNLLLGGDGEDEIIVDPLGTGVLIVDGGAGVDFLRARDGSASASLSLMNGRGTDLVRNVEGLIGTNGNDTLTGNAGGNIFRPGFGDDLIDGFDGDNLYVYTGGTDTIYGGNGRDALDFSEFAHAVRVDLGSDTQTARTNDSASAEVLPGMRVAIEAPELGLDAVIGTDQADHITGDANDNVFSGGLGDDTIIGVSGNNTFSHQGGLDTWTGGSGIDTANFSGFNFAIDVNMQIAGVTVRHRSGSDVSSGTLVGMVATTGFERIIGTAFSDRILGDVGDDEILGVGGDNALYGREGEDSISGGDGADLIYGGDDDDVLIGGLTGADGSDTIYGGRGNDQAAGGAGDDLIEGSAGDDTLSGEDGDDSLLGEAGADHLFGGAGEDTLDGGTEADDLQGGAGEDLLRGGAGDDMLAGDGGDDTLLGGAGEDSLSGGAGSDTLEGGAGADALDGGEGLDTASYAESGAAVQVSLDAATATGGDAAGDVLDGIENLEGSAQGDLLEGDAGDNVLGGADGGDTLAGLGGDDLLLGGTGGDSLMGGDGRDTLEGGSGADTLEGGAENDTLLGESGDDSLSGDGGEDVLRGGDGSDTLTGGAGDDTLNGNADEDLLRGGAGIDALHGDAGDDTLNGGASGDALYGGAGRDRADYAGASEGVLVIMQDMARNTGWAAFDTFDGIEDLGGTAHADDLRGDDAANALLGGAGNDLLIGRGGADTLEGGADDDTLYGNEGADLLIGGSGADDLRGGTAGDTIDGGTAEDTIFGGTGHDSIDAGSNADLVYGEDGNDTIDGGSGLDTISGGAGDDSIVGGSGHDSILGGSGHDSILGGSGDDTLSGGDHDDSLDGSIGADVISGGDGRDMLLGGSGDDDMNGDADDDSAEGGDGDDLIRGGLGADTLLGEAGADTLAGNEGDDLLSGGDDADLIFGGDDHDTINGDAGNDTLSGDVGLDLVRGGDGEDSISGGAGADTLAGNDGNDTIQGGDGDDGLFGGSGDDDLDGEAGNDTVDGSAGADLLRGGAGNDVLLGGADADTLAGNEGDDTVLGGTGVDRIHGGLGFDSLSGGDGADQIWGDDDHDTIDGGAGADLIRGGTGNDSILGGLGADILAGNEGDDTLEGGADGDRLIGGEGADNLRGDAGDDTLQGDLGEDVMRGDSGDDLMQGGEGADTLEGGSGADRLEGGTGADLLRGDAGNDRLLGEDDDDVLSGNDGADLLEGGDGNDRLFGGADDDDLRGDAGGDTLQGGTGRDMMRGGDGEDLLQGEDGSDTLAGNGDDDSLEGGAGEDLLFGGSGNDTLLGGDGTDTLSGDDGADVFVFGTVTESPHGAARDTIADFESGVDLIDLSGLAASLSFTGAYTGTAGEVRYNATIGRLYVDLDGDMASDLSVDLTGAPVLTASDLIL